MKLQLGAKYKGRYQKREMHGREEYGEDVLFPGLGLKKKKMSSESDYV